MDFNKERRRIYAIVLQDENEFFFCRCVGGDALREECLQFWGGDTLIGCLKIHAP